MAGYFIRIAVAVMTIAVAMHGVQAMSVMPVKSQVCLEKPAGTNASDTSLLGRGGYCNATWSSEEDGCSTTEGCGNCDNDELGSWCMVNANDWCYCEATIIEPKKDQVCLAPPKGSDTTDATLIGVGSYCNATWSSEEDKCTTTNGCVNCDNDKLGSWCMVNANDWCYCEDKAQASSIVKEQTTTSAEQTATSAAAVAATSVFSLPALALLALFYFAV